MTYTLGMGRLAAVQVCARISICIPECPPFDLLISECVAGRQVLFWGNPLTSGHADSIDYFVTGARMRRMTRHACLYAVLLCIFECRSLQLRVRVGSSASRF